LIPDSFLFLFLAVLMLFLLENIGELIIYYSQVYFWKDACVRLLSLSTILDFYSIVL
jgi:hypothetical protein